MGKDLVGNKSVNVKIHHQVENITNYTNALWIMDHVSRLTQSVDVAGIVIYDTGGIRSNPVLPIKISRGEGGESLNLVFIYGGDCDSVTLEVKDDELVPLASTELKIDTDFVNNIVKFINGDYTIVQHKWKKVLEPTTDFKRIVNLCCSEHTVEEAFDNIEDGNLQDVYRLLDYIMSVYESQLLNKLIKIFNLLGPSTKKMNGYPMYEVDKYGTRVFDSYTDVKYLLGDINKPKLLELLSNHYSKYKISYSIASYKEDPYICIEYKTTFPMVRSDEYDLGTSVTYKGVNYELVISKDDAITLKVPMWSRCTVVNELERSGNPILTVGLIYYKNVV